jgi:sterol desaturase/sphingolipid hydroxylase (fatty acid hydroxylase superfamily)
MPTTLIIGIAAIMTWAGILMAFMQYAAVVKMPHKRLRTPKPNRVTLMKKIINVSGNMGVSVLLLIGTLYFAGTAMITTESAGYLTIFGEGLAILLLYDFMYYFFHRGMHHPKVMKKVHGVHHYIRHPTAFESVYVHPLEGIGGNVRFLLSTFILGPVSSEGFLLAFTIYTTCNILVHANIKWEHPAMKLANYWAQKHDIHHGVHLNRNYASIFPFWDKMFGTYA